MMQVWTESMYGVGVWVSRHCSITAPTKASDLDVLLYRSLVFTHLSAPAMTISPGSFRLSPRDSTFY
ncbi:MAG TPA: hypothetical protein VLB06_10040 [Sulfuricaulis sp.]|nr:hypothetical protein [Sulfuricaulis sp.]